MNEMNEHDGAITTMESGTEPAVLDVRNLSISFSMYTHGFQKIGLPVVNGLWLTIRRGEIVAVLGSSGSGKSLLAHAILGILPANAATSGDILYRGEALTAERQKKYRGREIALIPQSVDFLDPLMRVGKQAIGVRGTKERQEAAFRRYGLSADVERMYPHQLSGGMARRVMIATAVMGDPKLIVADEPTPGLGAERAARIMGHFRELAMSGASILLITHDIGIAAAVADRIAIFYAGTTVEIAPASDFDKGKNALRHPYSKALVEALPRNGFVPIPGAQPYASAVRQGCLFYDRCPCRTSACMGEIEMRDLRGGEVRCIHAA